MNVKKTLWMALIITFAASWTSVAAVVDEDEKPIPPGLELVSLDAAKLPDGPLAAWRNTGALGGSFKSVGTSPQVKTIDGVKAVDFDGKQCMLADFIAPESITGDMPWTVIVKTYGRDITRERTLLAWSTRPDNALEIEYGTATLWGALGTWGAFTTGWGANVPEAKKWHTLVYCYFGGKDSDFQAWSDGRLIVNKKATLATKPGMPFVLGACMTGEPDKNPGYTHQIDGAIASVRVYNYPFTLMQAQNACGKFSAIPIAPALDSQLDTLTATLKWTVGAAGVYSYDVYVGTDRSAVEKATNKLPAGKASDLKRVFKGNVPVAITDLGPIPLKLGTTYYWRIDQLDSAGKVTQPGEICKFSTETGNATAPAPADSYIFVEGGKHILSWAPGKYAAKQNIYIGESPEAVLAKKKPDIANLPVGTTSVRLPIANPVLGKTYCWRVESVNSGKLGVSKGDVWSFRTVSNKLKVYLLGGQSNAVGCTPTAGMDPKLRGFNKNVIIFIRGECRVGDYGWAYLKDGLGSSYQDDGNGTIGPELMFGYDMAPQDPAHVMAILKCAWGGTNLGIQWRPPSSGGDTGTLYTNFVKAVHEGIAALDPAFQPEICGMLWMQGESDTGDPKLANEYEKNLTNLITDIRAEVKKPDMPFVHATISKFDAWKAYGDIVREAEANVAKTVPHTATFPTDDYGATDPWHYDLAGELSLGQRFAKAMKELEK